MVKQKPNHSNIESSPNLSQFWEKHKDKFWFLRGVFSAITILGLLTSYTDISQYKLLRAAHALLVGWNNWMAFVGNLIGQLPLIPELDSVQVNFLILFSMLVPYGFFMKDEDVEVVITSTVWRRYRAILIGFGLIIGLISLAGTILLQTKVGEYYQAIILLIGTTFMSILLALSMTKIALSKKVAIGLGISLLIVALICGTLLFRTLFNLLNDYDLVVSLIIGATLLLLLVYYYSRAFSITMGHFKHLRHGFLSVLGFITVLEMLYLLNLPMVSETLETFTNSVLGPVSENIE